MDPIACEINFSKRFSLPFGVAPDVLTADQIKTYIKSLDIGAELLNDTFTKPTPSNALNKAKIKKIVSSDNFGYLLNAESTFGKYYGQSVDGLDYICDCDLAKVNMDVKRLAIYDTIKATNPPDIAKELMKKVVYNSNKNSVSLLPMPYHSFDAIRCYWQKDSATPLTNTMGLDYKGPTNPYLLETSGTSLGELDRLVIRSPLTGLVRYEPYYHFKLNGNNLEVLCPSNSGRLVIRGELDNDNNQSETRLYEESEFIIENVDRASVMAQFNKLLSYTIGNFKNFAILSTDMKSDTTPPATFKTDSANFLYEKYKVLVSRALKAWLLFKKNINCIKNDSLTWDTITATFANYTLFEGCGNTRDVQVILTLLELIQNTPDWKKAFSDFLEGYYVPLLCGVSWYEARNLYSNDDISVTFPVASSEYPKNGTNEGDRVKQLEHLWLEQIYDESAFANGILCYRGCPVGYPSKVYRAIPYTSLDKKLPEDALTTYELEAMHLAGRNTDLSFTFTSAEPREPKPATCLSLDGYKSCVVGYCASFQMAKDTFYTLIDWLQELVKETNGVKLDPPPLDISKYYKANDKASTHPLLNILQYDNYTLCQSIRKQMDVYNTLKVDGGALLTKANLQWWVDKVSFIVEKKIEMPFPNTLQWPDGSQPAPTNQFMSSRTNLPNNCASSYFDVIPSGFDLFDLESVFLARNAVYNYLTGKFDMPLPVILAILHREGVNTFAWLYRNPYPKQPFGKAFSMQGHLTKTITNDTDQNDFARYYFLGFIFGLDTYNHGATSTTAANARFDMVLNNYLFRTDLSPSGVLNRNLIKDAWALRKYISERVYAPATNIDGIPFIRKNSRRSQWAFIILMLGWYQSRQTVANKKTQDDSPNFNYTMPDWFDNHYSDEQGNINALDPKRKDFITYYTLLYLAYNSGQAGWNDFIQQVEAAYPTYIQNLKLKDSSGNDLSLDDKKKKFTIRDYLLFKYKPTGHIEAMSNLIHFAATLDSYCRIVYDKTDVTVFDNSKPNDRNWGIA
jgi:hypothetical protein